MEVPPRTLEPMVDPNFAMRTLELAETAAMPCDPKLAFKCAARCCALVGVPEKSMRP
jgi:hypothetical protein